MATMFASRTVSEILSVK